MYLLFQLTPVIGFIRLFKQLKFTLKMKAHLITIGLTVLAVIVGLMVYNMFISGSTWFGHYEGSNNYDTDSSGNVIDMTTGQRIAI